MMAGQAQRRRGLGVHGEDTALHRRSASDVSTTSGRNAEGTFSDVWRTIKGSSGGVTNKLQPSGSNPSLHKGHTRTFSNLSVDTFYESFMCADSLHRKRGFWLAYFCSIFTTWLLLCTFTDPGLALTWLNIVHALCTFPAFHVFKIQRFDKQNIYDGEAEPQTYWEQIDNGKQWTKTRKALLVAPVVLYLLATNSTDFERQPLLINLLAMLASVVPKLRAQ